MKLKFLLASFIVLTSLLFVQKSAFAQTPTAKPSQDQRIASIKARSDMEIDKRLDSLNKATARIAGAKKLSDADKQTFGSEIQKYIADLTALRAKIDADTDLATLKTDAKTIYSTFRVYAVFLPQIHLLSAADIMGVAADNLTTISGKLSARLTALQAKGKDVSALQSLLTDMNAKIADAKTQYAAVESEIVGLTPASYPGSTATIKDAREKIKAGAADLKAARNDAKQIRDGIHDLNKTKNDKQDLNKNDKQ